jgi:hypothetical protein
MGKKLQRERGQHVASGRAEKEHANEGREKEWKERGKPNCSSMVLISGLRFARS